MATLPSDTLTADDLTEVKAKVIHASNDQTSRDHSTSHSRSKSWDGTRAALLSVGCASPPRAPLAAGGTLATPGTPQSAPPSPPKKYAWLRRYFWLALGFRTTPETDTIQLLVVYTVSASVMLAVNKHLARTERYGAIFLVQLQLGTSLVVIGAAKMMKKIDLTMSVTQGGPHEMYAWMALSILFALQLVASIRTLQTHHVTEWWGPEPSAIQCTAIKSYSP
jgi:hypothetical protein